MPLFPSCLSSSLFSTQLPDTLSKRPIKSSLINTTALSPQYQELYANLRQRIVLSIRTALISSYRYNKNASNAPFLQKLPGESRDSIYEEVLGNSTIHIGTRYCPSYDKGAFNCTKLERLPEEEDTYADQKLSHAVCLCKESEHEVYNRLRSCSLEDGCHWLSVTSYEGDRHKPCLDVMKNFENTWEPRNTLPAKERARQYAARQDQAVQLHKQTALDLGLLRVCRQIYDEAALITYASNTFAFTCGFALDLFISETLLTPQREAIQSLQFGNGLPGGQDWDGRPVPSIRRKTVLLLKNLKCVQVAVEPDGISGPDCFDVFAGLSLDSARVYEWYDADYDYEAEEEQANTLRCARGCIEARQRADSLERLLKGHMTDEARRIIRCVDPDGAEEEMLKMLQ